MKNIFFSYPQVMYSVTGLQFSYTQAPESMRSVLQGCWQLTVGVGNLIVTIIVGAKFFNSQTYEFALFAGLMFVDMGLFMWLALRYKAIPLSELDKIDEEQKALESSEKKDPLDFPGTSNETRED
jgi:solute carrier family 15 (oligopeptide transporter), member 1